MCYRIPQLSCINNTQKQVICLKSTWIIPSWIKYCRLCWNSYRNFTKNSHLIKYLIMVLSYRNMIWEGYFVSKLSTDLIILKHVWRKFTKHVGNVSEYNNKHPQLGYFCTGTIKAWITLSNQTGKKTSRKQTSTQTSSPVNKIVWRTEWAALGRWKSIKSGVHWVFGGGCMLFLPDKNISVLDLVMPREDYRLAGAAVGLTH